MHIPSAPSTYSIPSLDLGSQHSHSFGINLSPCHHHQVPLTLVVAHIVDKKATLTLKLNSPAYVFTCEPKLGAQHQQRPTAWCRLSISPISCSMPSCLQAINLPITDSNILASNDKIFCRRCNYPKYLARRCACPCPLTSKISLSNSSLDQMCGLAPKTTAWATSVTHESCHPPPSLNVRTSSQK